MKIAHARALHLGDSLLPNTLGMLKHLRYLYVGNTYMDTLPETLCLLYNLQTLNLNSFYLRELPENIKNLINLQYFHLGSGEIQQLPESIFMLRNLHTLSLEYCTELKELPRGIEQLTRLCILDLPLSLINMPSGIGKLTTLKPLRGHFSVMDHGMIGGLGELKNMNKLSGLLCISGLRNISDVEYSKNANLASKPNLHKLILNFQEDHCIMGCRDKELHLVVYSSTVAKNENGEKIQDVVLTSLQPHGNLRELAILNYEGRILPSWLLDSLLPKLTTLTLNLCAEPNFLPPFGQLPFLTFLDISCNIGIQNVGDELSTYLLLAEYGCSKQPKEPSYPSLIFLSLKNLLNLVEWQAHDGDFPHLEDLTIENCLKLGKIGIIPQQVREVTFKYCPKLKLLTCPSVIERLTIHECGFCEIMFGSISQSLKISKCIELISIDWMNCGLNSVELVSFKYCPKLEFVTIPIETLKLKIHECGFRKVMFWSVYEKLAISNCAELISINSMNYGLNYARVFSSEYCPKLEHHVPVKGVLHSMTQRAEIYDCPRMNLGKRYVYQRDPRIKELNLVGNNEIHLSCASVSVNSTIPLLEKPFTLFLTKEDFIEVESLTCAPLVGVNCECVMLNLASLVMLNISLCTKVISVTGLDNLSNLKLLSISYCPELCNWNDRTLPLSLKFLELDSCDKLSSLPLLSVQNNLNTLNCLVIKKCPRLTVLEGFHGLLNLKTVELLHCKNINISPATESLQFRPHFFIVACPLMSDWCQRNNITYNELMDDPRDDRGS